MNRTRLYFTKSKEEVNDHAKRFWGHDDIVLTKEDINKMLDGYFIYYDDGEYSTSLSVEGCEGDEGGKRITQGGNEMTHLNDAIDEIKRALLNNKSDEVKEVYLRNAIRFIEEAQLKLEETNK